MNSKDNRANALDKVFIKVLLEKKNGITNFLSVRNSQIIRRYASVLKLLLHMLPIKITISQVKYQGGSNAGDELDRHKSRNFWYLTTVNLFTVTFITDF